MRIKFWGARGSIPVSGKKYLKYGGDTTCVEIRTKEDQIIIVDAGSGIRRLGKQLLREKRYEYSLIFTHAHWDHLLGFPFFRPIYMPKTKIKVIVCSVPHTSPKNILSTVMAPPNFPVNLDEVKASIRYDDYNTCLSEFSIGTIQITPIPLSHPNNGIGYKFVEEGKSFVFLTDNELGYRHEGAVAYEDYLEFCKDADFLVHDAEYTPKEYEKYNRSYGHSTYIDALNLAFAAKVSKFGLFHHNQDRTDEQLDEIVEDCHRIIKEKNSNLECFAVHTDMEIEL